MPRKRYHVPKIIPDGFSFPSEKNKKLEKC